MNYSVEQISTNEAAALKITTFVVVVSGAMCINNYVFITRALGLFLI